MASAAVPPSGRGWHADREAGSLVVALEGDWLAGGMRPADLSFAADVLAGGKPRSVAFDAKDLGRWDSALLVSVDQLRTRCAALGVRLDERGLPGPVLRLLALVPDGGRARAPSPRRVSAVERVGRMSIGLADEAVAATALVGECVLRGGAAVRGRARMRLRDLLAAMRDAGMSALPIVAVVNLLVGGILAFVGAVQLRRFGADIYVANLVGVAVVREMAALMTAIVMAGRTGGAYAAQIASMQGSEELDALRAIGIPVVDYLVLPRVVALLTMMPLLYLYGCFFGIAGGYLVAVAMLHLPSVSFVTQLTGSLGGWQFVFGLGKSAAFGALVAIAGCRIGMKAGRTAAAVGSAATGAVVTGIVGVIALDALFAVCANAVGF